MQRPMTGLKVLLIAHGIKAADFARVLDVPYTTLSSYMGGFSRPSDELVDRIANKLKVRRVDLYQPPLRKDLMVKR